jgi:DNA polymerase V
VPSDTALKLARTDLQPQAAKFSSNYALYGDISERVMSVIESMVPDSETYSIDEKFADLTGIPGDLTQFGRQIRSKVLMHTGIPVGVGIAHTKTLAKLANHTAKKLQNQTGGVVDICDPAKRDWVLKRCDVGDVWGVGKRMKAHLEAMGIKKPWTWPRPTLQCSAVSSAW